MAQFSLPEADGVQEGCPIQWWYWTAHLEDEQSRRFGAELTFFAVDKLGVRAQLSHNAISDIGQGTFHAHELIEDRFPKKYDSRFDLFSSDGTMAAEGGGGSDTLHSQISEYVLDLNLIEGAQPVLHYDANRHDYHFKGIEGPSGYTYYYSRERMGAKGHIQLPDGTKSQVHGNVWFDRQWGMLTPASHVGWQWFAIQLDNRSNVMLFTFHDQPNETYGSLTYPDGTTQVAWKDDIKIEVKKWWRSPKTKINYPSEWEVLVLDSGFTITPEIADQELISNVPFVPKYWEGACRVIGTQGPNMVRGKAYVELNGFKPTSGPN